MPLDLATLQETGINKEVGALLALVDVHELTRATSSLRKGTPCNFYPREHLGSGALMSCANYHARIVFDNRANWLAWLPRTTGCSDIPPDLVDYPVESEYATRKQLEVLDAASKALTNGFLLKHVGGRGIIYSLTKTTTSRPLTIGNLHVSSQRAKHLARRWSPLTSAAYSIARRGLPRVIYF
jgi:hypothetical protein